ncbi:MAG: carboxypeptidase-like regulatory domain-containing protein [Bacteroides sp.]|nr:carboxypeptidase-like regulatory domain-containing protein [Bacteroides sp.]
MKLNSLSKKTFLFVVYSLFCCLMYAQERTISGIIKDISDEEMIGVNVMVKGTTNGTITDMDGSFRLSNVSENSVLVISYVGYLTQEIKVGQQSSIQIVLKEDAQALDELVVVGYGVQRKSDLTGSVGSVNNDNLVKRGATTVMESLQGQIAG